MYIKIISIPDSNFVTDITFTLTKQAKIDNFPYHYTSDNVENRARTNMGVASRANATPTAAHSRVPL